mmetsp:Transcript_34831/g.40312  ORF Transcript_34831/g.40312 Transcript_34831/m.40312 type:complete len:127 (-) Transcript_34831:1099-1479(-)
MGWKSGADPMHNMTIQMKFDNALQAVNFAKQRGWKYVVDAPKFRQARSDGAIYQDNFLPKLVAEKIVRQGMKCDHFYREKAGASHYFCLLKLHCDGVFVSTDRLVKIRLLLRLKGNINRGKLKLYI